MSKIFQRQFSALNRKNWLIYKRNLCVVLGELLLPLVMMMFIVSIRKVSKPIYNKQQSYELDGFYADNNYVDSTYMFKNSEFDWMQTQAIGIIGDDSDGILDETLDSFYKNSRSRFNGSKPYKTIHFDTVKDFNTVKPFVQSPPLSSPSLTKLEKPRSSTKFYLYI